MSSLIYSTDMATSAETKIKLAVAKATDNIRNKFKELYNERKETKRFLEDQYKPITKKINTLIDLNKDSSNNENNSTQLNNIQSHRLPPRTIHRRTRPSILYENLLNNSNDNAIDRSYTEPIPKRIQSSNVTSDDNIASGISNYSDNVIDLSYTGAVPKRPISSKSNIIKKIQYDKRSEQMNVMNNLNSKRDRTINDTIDDEYSDDDNNTTKRKLPGMITFSENDKLIKPSNTINASITRARNVRNKVDSIIESFYPNNLNTKKLDDVDKLIDWDELQIVLRIFEKFHFSRSGSEIY